MRHKSAMAIISLIFPFMLAAQGAKQEGCTVIGAAKAAFAEAAHLPPGKVIKRLVEAGEAWANGRPQDDDITFVAMRVK